MLDKATYRKYAFQANTGYVVAPWNPAMADRVVALRHTALVTPWSDPDIHIHEASEEYYLLLQGNLWFLVAGELLTLKPI